MFPAAHPDIMVQLANARIADLHASAARLRRARPFLAGWGKAGPGGRGRGGAGRGSWSGGPPGGGPPPPPRPRRQRPAGPPVRPGPAPAWTRRKRRPWLVALPGCWPPGPG